MTAPEINQELAAWCGPRKYLLIKNGYYWRPNSAGYTSHIDQAGRYEKEFADHLFTSTRGEVTWELEPVPNYCEDLNATHDFEEKLMERNTEQWEIYCYTLKHRRDVKKSCHAPARARAEELLNAINTI